MLGPEGAQALINDRPATRYAEKLAQSVGMHGPSDCQQALRDCRRVASTQPLAIVIKLDKMTCLVYRSAEEVEEAYRLAEQPGSMRRRSPPRPRIAGYVVGTGPVGAGHHGTQRSACGPFGGPFRSRPCHRTRFAQRHGHRQMAAGHDYLNSRRLTDEVEPVRNRAN